MAAPTFAQTGARVRHFDFNEPSGYDVVVKAIIIGNSGVGKSSLLYRYTDQDWNPHYIATIGVDFKVLTFERDNRVVKLQLWDSAGQERFRSITWSYYRGTHGVMMVFDLTDSSSFQDLQVWLQDVRKFGAAGLPLVLVGNKCDAPASAVQVSDEEAKAFAEQLGCQFVKTSAKNNASVDQAFELLVEQCIALRLKQPIRKPAVGGVIGNRPVLPPRHTTETKPTCAC